MRIALVLALGVSVTTCRLDKLINPATADRIVVSPDSVRASANVGSLEAVDTTLHVSSADGGTVMWTATKTAAWVTLTPTPDSLIVALHPDTLSQTLHRDTIVFTSPQSVNTVKVPIVFDMLPPAAELVVSPTDRDTSAFVRSAQPDTFSLRIKNRGALLLTWTATLDTTWVTVSDSGGTVPPQDTTSTLVLVTLRPESLSTGVHSSRIVFSATGAIGSPDTVSITYTIDPCLETPISALDAVVSGSITLSDCGAPQKAGRQAKLYSVQATGADTLSFRVTASFNAYLILTNSTGAVVLDSLDQCGTALTACLLNYHVTTAGRHVIEVTTTNAGETGAFTLTAVKEISPIQPAPGQFRANGTTAIGVGAITPESTVVFRATVNDPNPFDSVRLEVEVTELASGPVTYLSGFVPPGTSVTLPVTGLQDNQVYHWRARTCDLTTRCSTWFSFGGNPESAADFIVNSAPNMPDPPTGLEQLHDGILLEPGGGTGGGVLGSTEVVTFRALVTDPDPGDLVSIEVEWKLTDDPFDGTNLSRGGLVASNMTASRDVAFVYPALGAQKDYYWRARACDQAGQCGAWVSFGGTPGDSSPRVIDFHVP